MVCYKVSTRKDYKDLRYNGCLVDSFGRAWAVDAALSKLLQMRKSSPMN